MATTDVGLLTRRGMAKFIKARAVQTSLSRYGFAAAVSHVHSAPAQNDVSGSVDDFDLVLRLEPRQSPYLWQRGLSLYYLERFADGAQQFRDDVAVNPNDTEESIWALLCEARLAGFQAAQEKMLTVGRDSRPVMRAAYELFRGTGSMDELRSAAGASPHDQFYSLLYQGLYHEAKGDQQAAKAAMLAATQSTYGAQSGDYMAALAKVHVLQRGWAA